MQSPRRWQQTGIQENHKNFLSKLLTCVFPSWRTRGLKAKRSNNGQACLSSNQLWILSEEVMWHHSYFPNYTCHQSHYYIVNVMLWSNCQSMPCKLILQQQTLCMCLKVVALRWWKNKYIASEFVIQQFFGLLVTSQRLIYIIIHL